MKNTAHMAQQTQVESERDGAGKLGKRAYLISLITMRQSKGQLEKKIQ